MSRLSILLGSYKESIGANICEEMSRKLAAPKANANSAPPTSPASAAIKRAQSEHPVVITESPGPPPAPLLPSVFSNPPPWDAYAMMEQARAGQFEPAERLPLPASAHAAPVAGVDYVHLPANPPRAADLMPDPLVGAFRPFYPRHPDAVPPPDPPICAPWVYIPGPMYVAPATDWAGRLILIWRATPLGPIDQCPPLRDDPRVDTDCGIPTPPPAPRYTPEQPPAARRARGPPASSWEHLAMPSFRDVAENLDLNTAMSSMDAMFARQTTLGAAATGARQQAGRGICTNSRKSGSSGNVQQSGFSCVTLKNSSVAGEGAQSPV